MADSNGALSQLVEAASGRQAELEKLVAQATSKYSVKDYDAAAELYSQATELQAEVNGEMAAENAELLYAYGRCLYHAAVRNSDVLGPRVAGATHETREEDMPKAPNKKEDPVPNNRPAHEGPGVAGDDAVQHGGHEERWAQVDNAQGQVGKPYFQFTGDENFDDTDDEAHAQEPDGGTGEGVEEEDDFANAFEVLDLARVLLLKQLGEEKEKKQDNGYIDKNHQNSIRRLKERLADTHDLQAEISLESEKFPCAVDDLRAALDLKMRLFPEESSLIAEAHYKLSLALEFSSMTQPKDEDGEGPPQADVQVDEAMREEAAKEMESAIRSCKLRVSREEAALLAEASVGIDHDEEALGTGRKIAQGDVDDVKEMVADMEQRLAELRRSPVSIKDPSVSTNGDGAVPSGGFLGSILGESPATQREKLTEASRGAKDLSNLVKRKKLSIDVVSELAENDSTKDGSKRKVEFVEEVVEVGTGKKAKLSDGFEDKA
ncbi:MAG: hypothetical protein LQ341_000067 [Variospora aurantia]|nr:MAG: hypothetical protein LQ341_000067 [Variospora aurantia]